MQQTLLNLSALLVVCPMALGLVASQSWAAPSFQGVGVTASGYSQVDSISGDGSTVGGYSREGVFRWTVAGGKQFVETPLGYSFNRASGLSYDGRTLVGWAYDRASDENTPSIESAGDPVVSLRSLMRNDTGDSVAATDVSADGSLVVGYGVSSTRGTESFLYDDVRGLRYLSDLTGDTRRMLANAISADGSVVVGYLVDGLGTQAMVYDEVRGVRGLGGLEGLPAGSVALGISADGATVVGSASSSIGRQAMIYREGLGMVGLGILPHQTSSEALDTSADGHVVVGVSGTEAFIYDPANGMRPLRDYLAGLGLDIGRWSLDSATAISDDGMTIVGRGINPFGQDEGWVAVIPEPTTALLLGAGLCVFGAGRNRKGIHRA